MVVKGVRNMLINVMVVWRSSMMAVVICTMMFVAIMPMARNEKVVVRIMMMMIKNMMALMRSMLVMALLYISDMIVGS